MKIPLIKKIKRREYLQKAILQDLVVLCVYEIQPNAVFHGGTSLWRCYNGNRFSDDLDFYFVSEKNFKNKLDSCLKSKGLKLIKYKETKHTIFSKISDGKTDVKIEVSFENKKGEITRYELVDGSFIDILALTPKQLFYEKMSAYKNRRLARDIYDIYFLIRLFDLDERDKSELANFLDHLNEPVDKESLKSIVLTGLAPSFEQIVSRLKGVIK